jgi:hypothetical protein
MERLRDDRNFRYHVDTDDRIVFYTEGWYTFARENGGGELARDEALRQSLWRFISGEETRHLYRLILSRVRAGKRVVVPVRCDSPNQRRHLELRIESLAPVVVFESAIMREEPRAYVSLLDATRDRSIDVVSICSWCKRVQVPGSGWHEVEEAVDLLGLSEALPPQLVHLCCYECYRRIIASL